MAAAILKAKIRRVEELLLKYNEFGLTDLESLQHMSREDMIIIIKQILLAIPEKCTIWGWKIKDKLHSLGIKTGKLAQYGEMKGEMKL